MACRESPHKHLVFVIPKDAPCWWTGVSDIGGSRVWVKATTAKALQHELGHNLGMDHAVHWRSSEAEGSDLMGSGGTSLNASCRPDGMVAKLPRQGGRAYMPADVTLEARSRPIPGSPLCRRWRSYARRPAPTYLSYRTSTSTNPTPDEFTRGLNIHIVGRARQTGGLTYFVTSLSDGAEYEDGLMIVQQLSHAAGGSVSFRIRFTGTSQALPAGLPPAPPGTVQSVATGKCLDLPGGQGSDGTLAI